MDLPSYCSPNIQSIHPNDVGLLLPIREIQANHKPPPLSRSLKPYPSTIKPDPNMEDPSPREDISNGVVPAPLPHCQMTAAELVAKAIAPMRREFLRPPPVRNCDNSVDKNSDDKEAAQDDGRISVSAAPILKEKKSKRQLKRERRQEQKSVLHICPVVAKSGEVSACVYNENCRFSHDLEAFKSQKPADLDGVCPFLSKVGPCPYGLACRFAGTHKADDGEATTDDGDRKNSEMNALTKDVQRLLWKNRMKFPKADAALKLLGLQGQGKKTKAGGNDNDGKNVTNDEKVEGNGCCMEDSAEVLEEDIADKADVADEVRPPKKTKCSTDEACDAPLNGEILNEKDVGESCKQSEPEAESIVENFVEDNDKCLKLHPREKKIIDFRDKLYLAPLTTVGNLPFRRVCKGLGVDITCGEMAMCTNLLQGQASEWALLRRHSSEDFFGVQICGAYPDTVTRTVELIEEHCTVDFIDINMGCPIDIVCNKGAGSALLTKPMRMKSVVQASSTAVSTPVTIKVRTGYFEGKNRVDSLIADMGNWGATAVTVHGRTRQQRYSKLADWEYIYQCARAAPSNLQVLGNGDVFSYLDWNAHKSDCPELSTCMIARGALVKPWIFTEIKEQRHWDITSGERLNILKDYARFGLEHWGSDSKGVETTRHFLLEWLSYTCRYIPVGLLDVIPQKINWRPPSYFGRDDLETLMASDSAADWIRLTEMLLGKVPAGFTFAPKHKSNAYDTAENG
ncbi:LOW QUALITY PROTEIN: tRNA-dihydrouridine(47) synthase [NAD(P)(+)]-like [Salvia miltiorrhiza]|uniref:LOW QUALITY PROTEIN: tRNA-dihydrouridine(47) synthase [NAD(P)(+)]-like n=1 Tax=Salvia miltiorrhiza TaxID=226208 RepID=UPI0025ACC3B6|nr:LOW QUALITY PROTEIN: tRNA-dihydrouridine(47) synthase [NAD(P)(+)]-like [Salvia miltiorrhiza]